MRKFFGWIDEIAGTNREHKAAMWLERAAFVFLILMILSAPHSIAATQTAWLLGTATWLARFFIKPRPKFVRTPLDAALWVFFGWTAITSVFSYAPDISIDKLRGALLFLIFYFVVNNLRTIRAAKFLAFALLFSCMASVVYAPIERIYGRGVEIYGVSAEGLLAKAGFADGDAVLAAGGKKIRTPEDLLAEIEKNEVTKLDGFRTPDYFTLEARRADLLDGENSLEKLGIESWKHSRNWRYAGFYGSIITYAEVLQMIASLALGVFIVLDKKRSRVGTVLTLCLVGMVFAFLITFTRAPQIAFLASAIAMVAAFGNRKTMLTLAAFILPLAFLGFFFMQQSRKVNYYDRKDESVMYRQTVYREGFNLWTQDARKFLLGIGMDSTKRFAKDWHLFDDGRLPAGHFHSTPLQLLVERGLPALFLWFWVLWIYARTLLRKLKIRSQSEEGLRVANCELREENNRKSKTENPKSFDWQTTGIILGCFGGLVGFFVSSLVNYSLGDGEVAMVFYMLMGIGIWLSIADSRFQAPNPHSQS